jgi:hypothetical protein
MSVSVAAEYESTIKKKGGVSLQVILCVTYDDNRLLPLTEDSPICLLPIANRKLLGYQLDLLKQCGATGLILPHHHCDPSPLPSLCPSLSICLFLSLYLSTCLSLSLSVSPSVSLFIEIFVVTPKEYSSQLSQFLLPYLDDEVHIELIQVNELFGSADAVRAVHDRIRGDFIIYNSDTLSQINLTELVQTHRLQSSDVTMLLAVAPFEESEKKGVAPVMKVGDPAQLNLSLSLSPSDSLSLSLCLCLSVCVCLSVSFCLSVCLSDPWRRQRVHRAL